MVIQIEHITAVLFIIIFATYTANVVIKYGVQRSISYTFYVIKKPFHFILFCWAISITYLLTSFTLLSFIAASGIILVGGHPFIKKKHCYIPHMIFAIIGIAFSQLSIVFDYQNYMLFGISLAVFVLTWVFLRRHNFIWWLEVAAFLSIAINNFLILI